MSKTLKKHLATITKHLPDLKRHYHVKTIGVFGSVARGDATPKSDVDILVELSKPIGLFRFVGLEQELSELLGRKVDLVTKRALKPAIKEDILSEIIYVQKES